MFNGVCVTRRVAGAGCLPAPRLDFRQSTLFESVGKLSLSFQSLHCESPIPLLVVEFGASAGYSVAGGLEPSGCLTLMRRVEGLTLLVVKVLTLYCPSGSRPSLASLRSRLF